MQLSDRAKGISPSPTLAVDARAKELQAQGVDVVNFGVGEPDFDTPGHVCDAAIAAIRGGFTRYTPAAGTLELREAVCARLHRELALDYRPDEIVVSGGAKHSLYNAVMALCNPGDEVLIPAPYWVTYPEQVKLAGATPVIVPTDETHGFRVTRDALEQRVTRRTRLLILNSPGNPSGAVYRREEVEALAEFVLARDIYLISDEVYDRLVYDGHRHASPACFSPEAKARTVLINAVSKTYAMTGWRIGYAACHRDLARAMGELQGHATSNPASISQKAALAALKGPDEPVEAMRREFQRRRDYMAAELSTMPGMTSRVPEGAFYVFPNVSGLLKAGLGGRRFAGSDELAAFLLEEARVAVVAGKGFGSDRHLRFSYATSLERIQAGLARIREVLARF
ncbi:MAG TPA: pyridoxal phosphate-dependent aminotransferase [Bacillota bacterium]|nr:pyridoxal phosphate-dependent aminotransferase [Bacillota bacterium]